MSVEDRWHHKGTRERTKDYGRGKRWRVRNRGARTQSFAKQTAAKAYDNKVNAELLKGLQPFDHAAGKILFSEYVAKWLKDQIYDSGAYRSVESHIRNHLLPTFGHRRMCDIHTSTVVEWWAAMCTKTSRTGEKYSASTLESVYVYLGSILRSAVGKVIAVHPFDGWDVVIPKRDRAVRDIWEHERVTTVIGALPERERPIGLLSATCGHRPSEALAVALEDVNRFRKEVTIRHQVKRVKGKLVLTPPKGGKTRTVPIADVALTALDKHVAEYGTTTIRCTCCQKDWQIIFTDPRGKLICDSEWSKTFWHPAIKVVGLRPGRTTGRHNFRHYFASRLIEGSQRHRGASIQQVRDYMGHASIKTTSDIYGHLFEQAHERARSLMDDMFSADVYPLRTAEGR
ncbi:tyrosine-type recombinase/integrase [Amycolatopsis sp. cg5]|uniref:tyrosine-type recombinase/integrase n=1 Tax=Amycolatopsis sp. cg5 TaxID=3238802 RepID=UPI0035269BCE